MKVLIDATGIVNETTGVGQYSLQLLTALSEIDNKNDYSVILQGTLKNTHPIFNIIDKSNFNFIKKNIPSVGPKKQFRYYSFLKKNKYEYDLLHSFNSELPLFCHLKKIVTIHDLKYVKYPDFLNDFSSIKSKYLKHVIKEGVKKAEQIITDSQNTKNDIIDLFNIKSDKIRVIHLASNFDFNSKTNNKISIDKILQKYSIKKPYFLYVGEKRPHKNLMGLIQAFALFKKNYDRWNTYLVITGKKYSGYSEYLVEAEKLNIMDYLIFTEFIPDEYLKGIYSEAEALLLVSFYEGFGIPILEAMECKTPVITSKISSMPEVAGDAAILVDPNNIQEIAEKMHSIMNSDALKEALIKKGLKRVKEFSWEKTAKETLQVYNKIYNRKS